MYSLSKREKTLLTLLAIVIALAASVYFLALPAMENISRARERLDHLEDEKLQMENLLYEMEMLLPVYTQDMELLEQKSSIVLPPMQNEAIESMLTDMVIKSGLTPISLAIQMRENSAKQEVKDEEAFTPDFITVRITAQNNAPMQEQPSDEEAEETKPSGQNANGMAYALNLIESINHAQGMVLRSYTYDTLNEGESFIVEVDLYYDGAMA